MGGVRSEFLWILDLMKTPGGEEFPGILHQLL
jgi:hypothetical protein